MKVENGIKWVLVCRSLKWTPLRISYFIPYRLFRDFLLDRIILRSYFFYKDIFIKKSKMSKVTTKNYIEKFLKEYLNRKI